MQDKCQFTQGLNIVYAYLVHGFPLMSLALE